MSALSRAPSTLPSDPNSRLAQAMAAATEATDRKQAANTDRADEHDRRAWEKFCEAVGLDPEFPTTVANVAAFLGDMSARGLARNTIKRRRSWVSKMHRGLEHNPARHESIRLLIAGLPPDDEPRRKRALTPSMMRAAWNRLEMRDQALVTVAIVTGLRASELCALAWSDIKDHDAGRALKVRRSKTDQRGRGRFVALPRNETGGRLCPVRALERWREESGGEGPVFGIRPLTVNRVIKRVAKLAGEPPSGFGAHSTRVGMLTAATKASVPIATVMEQSGHKNVEVALGYVREEKIMENEAAHAIVTSLG